jgi:hypothetical protein
MEIRFAFGRNINISKELRKRYDKLQKGFLFKDREAKNIFMISMALGFINKSREKVKNPSPLLNIASFSDEDLWLMVAIAVEEKEGLSVLSNITEVKRIASEYANAGLIYLEELSADYGTGENLELAILKKAKEKLKK